jgi:hypothetical protein
MSDLWEYWGYSEEELLEIKQCLALVLSACRYEAEAAKVLKKPKLMLDYLARGHMLEREMVLVDMALGLGKDDV